MIDQGEITARLLGASDGFKEAVFKAEVGSSNQIALDNRNRLFQEQGVIEPPHHPEMLCLLFEHSSSLRPPVDSYAVNIDGFGHRLVPNFDLEKEEDRNRVKAVMMAKRKLKRMTDGGDDNAADGTPVPDEDDLESELGDLADEIIAEKQRLELFFRQCCLEHSFVKLRRLSRQDLEVMGNAYWEVLRDRSGEVNQFVYVPAFTIRLMPLGPRPVDVDVRVQRDDLTYETVKRKRSFRLFVQIIDTETVIFKQFGDLRTISSRTGNIYRDVDHLEEIEQHRNAATELKHFRLDSPRSSYGVPRWIGTLLSVMGSRLSEEVNFLYFDNKSVPPLALLVSGGKINEGSVERIESYIQNHVKGKQNFHKILVLEAAPATGGSKDAGGSRVKIELRPLLGAQHSDALFQKYDERNIDKVGSSFRLPRLLRGDIRDFNRSTASAALNFAEMQVFQPEREDFDWVMNHEFLNDLEARFWRFESRAPVTRDPVAMADIIRQTVNAGTLTPEEGRELLSDVFNRDFKKLEAVWTKIPPQLALELVRNGLLADPFAKGLDPALLATAGKDPDKDPPGRAKGHTEPGVPAGEALAKSLLFGDKGGQEREVLVVPRAEFEAWVTADAPEAD